ncbi:nitrate ABC transporter substrate-binding protein [Campylobacter pinnipediorum subsp. pinnipediorum]|uniref:ABC transporter substrate-binding protein n=1 Tax=Campylobacter pinnipediorum TaxID=1965231 RepID=UPI000994DEA9|nr:ABC transporter substrate-binding protein [Campylobacter pinnipediorum]OPA78233.1 nitrate ABC transporter substrate-binding protein [Campylobacter pinnipediorum subsp. pinnipediorum]
MKKKIFFILSMLVFVGLNANDDMKKLTIVLDWVPNTNHTGLFVAKDKGYFKDEGVDVDIVQPSEDSSSTIVGYGRAELGVYFQPNMVKRLLKKTPITAVAAILQHNTGGILSLQESNILSPKDMTGKKYSTWQDPIDDATIKYIVNKDGGNWDKISLIPGESTDATTALRLKMFDAILVYKGWDYIYSKVKNVKTNFFLLKDYAKEFDYYAPVIIANNDFLKNSPEIAKKALKAIKKGYEFAAKNPEQVAEVLIQNAPEGDKDLIRESQKFVSTQYIADAKSWGIIDPKRWNAFYEWLYNQKLIKEPLTNQGFTNEFLK